MKTTDIFGRPKKSGQKSVLGQRFRWSPFSCLNAQTGEWQDRKRAWIRLGIRSEIGRGEALTWEGDVGEDIDTYRHREAAKAKTYHTGGPATLAEDMAGKEKEANRRKFHAQPGGQASHKSIWLNSEGKPVGGPKAFNAKKANGVDEAAAENEGASQTGTSIFDPVLCELFYRWFTPADGIVLDPFAGGSVRGVVASVLGRRYVGLELRPEQIKANEEQAATICRPGEEPFWLEGDSRNIVEVVTDAVPGFKADAIFSCPPYFDLEQYSDDKRDLSNSTWDEFCEAYALIIKQSVSLLEANRFACFVVGDIRDEEGYYRDLPGLTKQYFRDVGYKVYGEAVLITAVGSLPLRTARQFTATRKLGRTHQYVLIFGKGDPKPAAEACEDIQWLSSDLLRLAERKKNGGV